MMMEQMVDRQIIVMTPTQLKEFGLDLLREYDRQKQETPQADEGDEYVYGIRGICELFHVSRVTANRWKQGFLKDAVMQRGRKIMTNVAVARRLYSEQKAI